MREVILVVVGFFIGNLAGDQQMIIDCNKKGEAKMFGGGTVKCEVARVKGEE